MLYTLGIWAVRPGHEADFEAAWQRLADQTVIEFPGSAGRLVRDTSNPQRYVSFGPWPDADTITRWRSSAMFIAGVADIRQHIDNFVPGTYELCAESGNTQ